MKKRSVLAIFLFVLVLVLTSFLTGVSADATKICCANPGTTIDVANEEIYCESDDLSLMISQDLCCPNENGGYNTTNPFYPNNRADCIANFTQSSCLRWEPCKIGCCYDVTEADKTQKCQGNTEFQCKIINETNTWVLGYAEGDRLYPNNPCYQDDLGIDDSYNRQFPKCPVKDVCTEIASTQEECRENPSCFYCPDEGPSFGEGSCFTQCAEKCGGYSTDKDSDRVCDTDQVYLECGDELCAEAEEACRCGITLLEEGKFCCELNSKAYSSEQSCLSNCYPLCSLNDPISWSNTKFGFRYTHCVCGENTVELSSGSTQWCCEEDDGRIILKNSKCFEIGTINGFVMDEDTGTPLRNARVKIDEETRSTNINGYYEFKGLRLGQHTIIVLHDDYKTKQEDVELTTDGQTLQKDFELEPVVTRCENPFAGPIDIGLTVSCAVNEKGFELTWSNPCPENILGFYVFRNNVPLSQLLAPELNTYTDDTYEWDSYVAYTVIPLYDYINEINPLDPMYAFTKADYYTGNENCVGNHGKEICNNNIRYKCEDCNRLRTVAACQAGETCLGPNNDDRTVCKSQPQCVDFGMPLGVFYNKEQCYGISNSNYCYYDYSKTIVDSCYECSPIMGCPAYRSEDACNKDNCIAAQDSQNCKYESTNLEFGKGICYQEDYDKSKYCEICNELFMNCDREDCLNLGRCYYQDDRCEKCTTNTKCSDYTSEQECIGGQPFEIKDDSLCEVEKTKVFSSDSCGLEYCRWNSLTNACYKDVNYDNRADSDGGDYSAPTTTISIPKTILGPGSEIAFDVSEDEYSTYYCIDKNGGCCPEEEILNNKVVLPNAIPETLWGENWYTIRYYSKDLYGNYEEIQESVFYADLAGPTAEFKHVIKDNVQTGHTSDLYINVTLSESANCTEILRPISFYDDNNALHPESGFTKKFKASYTNLFDALYSYVINCSDSVGNNKLISYDVEIDRMDYIFGESPQGGTISSSSKDISFYSKERGNCEYSKLDNAGYPTTYNIFGLPQEEGIPIHYKYQKTVTNLGNGLHEYFIVCRGSDWNDTTRLYFTVDREAPVTSFNAVLSNGEEEAIDAWFMSPIDFILKCFDYPKNIQPFGEPFGCKETKWCNCFSTECTCEPDTVGNKVTVTKYSTYCYKSEDLGGNIEDIRCKTVRIDEMPPSKPIVDDTSPVPESPEYYYRDDKLRVKFKSTDNQSGIDYYLVELRSEDNDTIVEWTRKTNDDEWVWFEQDDEDNWKVDEDNDKLDLENGTKYYFYVRAVDKSGIMSGIGHSDGVIIDTTKVPDHCKDSKKNEDETSIDCGGNDCLPCNETDKCILNRDCVTGFCHPISRICMKSRCDDGYRGGNESGKDCGGNCPKKCVTGSGCYNNNDCLSGKCNETTHTCYGVYNPCSNGVWDSDKETDVDCGGTCLVKCGTGRGCKIDNDCNSGICGANRLCSAPSCDDDVKNGDETDIDCGGSCSKCGNGKLCLTKNDCSSGSCEFNECSGSSDADNDGLPDSWERTYCEGDCDPNADPDGDGLTNLQEYQMGTDPNNPEDQSKKGSGSWIIWLLIIILLVAIVYFVLQKQKGKTKPKKPTQTLGPAPKPQEGITITKQTSIPVQKTETITKSDIRKQRRRAKESQREDIFKVFEEKKPQEKAAEPEVPEKGLEKIVGTEQIKEEDDVWQRLSKMTREELAKMGKSDKEVHEKLALMYGKRLDDKAVKKLSIIVSKEQITKSNIVSVFTELAVENKLSKGVLKNILSKMIQRDKITKKEIKDILNRLYENKAIGQGDITDILTYIDAKKK